MSRLNSNIASTMILGASLISGCATSPNIQPSQEKYIQEPVAQVATLQTLESKVQGTKATSPRHKVFLDLLTGPETPMTESIYTLDGNSIEITREMYEKGDANTLYALATKECGRPVTDGISISQTVYHDPTFAKTNAEKRTSELRKEYFVAEIGATQGLRHPSSDIIPENDLHKKYLTLLREGEKGISEYFCGVAQLPLKLFEADRLRNLWTTSFEIEYMYESDGNGNFKRNEETGELTPNDEVIPTSWNHRDIKNYIQLIHPNEGVRAVRIK